MKSVTFDQSAIMSDANNNSSTDNGILADDSGIISNIGASSTTSNPKKVNEKYSLRQRQKRTVAGRGAVSSGGTIGATTIASASSTATSLTSTVEQEEPSAGSGTTSRTRNHKEKSKPKAAPLSKYRRKTANARERTRMREINSAFENLRRCVPHSLGGGGRTSPTSTNEKLTKITTLRLAMKYIRTLSEALANPGYDISFLCNSPTSGSENGNQTMDSSSCSLDSLFVSTVEPSSIKSTTATTTVKSRSTAITAKVQNRTRQKTKQKSDPVNINNNNILMPSPSLLDDNPADLGLLLESDGESLHLSEPCLSPLGHQQQHHHHHHHHHHQIKPFACSNTTMSSSSSSSSTSGHLNDSALELGLLLESDSDSLQFSEPCLSPLAALDSFNPFGDLLHTEFTEQTSLDMYLT